MLDGESNISSSLILFNAQNDDVNTIFLDVPESTAESGRKIKNNLDDIKDIRPRGPKANESMPIRKYNNYLLEHIPEKFRTLKRMNILLFVGVLYSYLVIIYISQPNLEIIELSRTLYFLFK